MNLKKLLQPRAIAVVGASEKPGAGSLVIENLRSLGFEGPIVPVHPKYQRVLGLPCYPSLLDVPEEIAIDCVAIVLGAPRIMPVLEQARQRGVQGAWAFASGFAETGAPGAQLQQELKAFCDQNDIAFCGPNCVGFVNLHARVGTFSAPVSPTMQSGGVAAIAQSGSVILALANSNRGMGFSTLVSSGNEAVLDCVDYINYFINDHRTKVIALFLEGIRRPKEFIDACKRAAEAGKPIVAVKVGRSDLARRTVTSHTGAMAGADAVVDAVFDHLGVIRVDDLDQLMETAEALAQCGDRLPQGRGVGMVTVSGGEIGLVGDIARDCDFAFPALSSRAKTKLTAKLPAYCTIANPLDAWGSGDLAQTYPACLEILAQEEAIDLIAVSQDAPPGMAPKQIDQYADVARAAVRCAATGKPVVVFSHVSGGLEPKLKEILDAGRIPFLQGTRESLTAITHLIRYGRFQQARRAHQAIPPAGAPPTASLVELISERPGVQTYTDSRRLLGHYGIATPREAIVDNLADAQSAARSLGYPVVLKGLTHQVGHKTEAGLVQINIKTDRALLQAYETITAGLHEAQAADTAEGILVQEMVADSVAEMIVGIHRDADFGPVLMVGMGGVLVELLKDTRLTLPSLDLDRACRLIDSLQARRLLSGFRGRPPGDIDALAEALVAVGQLARDGGERIATLDINPLLVRPAGKGVVAADILMELT